jgi:hypothetical protein
MFDAVRRLVKAALGAACAFSLCAVAAPARAWSDEGHEVIALIADHYLEPAVRAQVSAILAGPMDREATWADRYRDSDRNTTKEHYNQTREWHYVNLELDGPDLMAACFGRPALPKETAASRGPADDCIVDKIDQFAAELANPATSAQERRWALEFLLHFVGDLHQPLHSSDDHDRGGNLKFVSAPGLAPNNLHHYWDVEFVARLGSTKADVARQLIANITDSQRVQWAKGSAGDWAMETYAIAKQHSYGRLPAPDSPNYYELSATYVEDATVVTREQLSKAGVRLAAVLNRALAGRVGGA